MRKWRHKSPPDLWIFGSSNQLHVNVVSSPNRGHYVQKVCIANIRKAFIRAACILIRSTAKQEAAL
ncbi:unnamed protein product [Thlaspi arvense]|uniref:Uncharacterized protein n=1 Tax=Thlaspi arvense TaxID=13288 RepID=A0AAU9RGP2_THLAR|nr:unnamed protein product [Thlaspi arvense]